ATDRAPICTRPAEAPALTTDSRSTVYRRPCSEALGYSPQQPCFALEARVAKRSNYVRRFRKQPLFKLLIDPRLGDNAVPIVRADFFLVGLDQKIECSRLDIALLGENALKSAYTQLHFRQVRLRVIVRKLGRRFWQMIRHEKSIQERYERGAHQCGRVLG